MTGRLRSSFRSGNIAEDLGILLLKGISAVADVPRTEDVGLDAVASLLRRDEDGNCYAEDSFVVQIKSSSITSLDYRDHELEWLVGQSLPMFIGQVSLKESKISLYPTFHANQAVLALHSAHITIRFGESTLPAFLVGQRYSPWVGNTNDSATVWLGNPVLEWSLSDITDPEWSPTSYKLLKRFLAINRREIELLAYGQTSVVSWSTNDIESIQATCGIGMSGVSDLQKIAERSAPALHALMLEANGPSIPDQTTALIMTHMIGLSDALRDIGVEIDAIGQFARFYLGTLSKHLKP